MLQTFLTTNTSVDTKTPSNSEGSTETRSPEQIEYDSIQKIIGQIPEKFNLRDILEKYATNYNECMNTVLSQECTTFNKLIDVIVKSLVLTQKALKGLVVKTKITEQVRQSLKMNMVPPEWAKHA